MRIRVGYSQYQVSLGERLGSLTVMAVGTGKAVCACECGTLVVRPKVVLRTTVKPSCGRRCGKRQKLTTTPGYMSWQSAKNRCANPNARNYRYYGGRGIQMCERWKGSFAAFISDMGLPSLGQSLDRIDNNGDYEPDNCRWATQLEQQQNMRKNVLLTLDGRTQCVSAWAREYGMDVNAFYNRLRLGWEMRRALTQPVRAKRRRQRAEAA